VQLGVDFWRANGKAKATVIVNPATGVLAKYYHRYAAFLAAHGFDVLTYDYRGIGASRPASLRRCGHRWYEWGTRDFAAIVEFATSLDPEAEILIVGHSIGGFLPGLADNVDRVRGIVSIGAQYAYWRDYAPAARLRLLLKWHIAMPAITVALGYFPGKRLGWLEDLPTGVALEWAFRGSRMENSLPLSDRTTAVERFAAFEGDIVAVAVSDDHLGSEPAVRRGLGYYRNARKRLVQIEPADLGFERLGHFDLFHSRHRDGFWRMTVSWLNALIMQPGLLAPLSEELHPLPAQEHGS
jgi:predicted alpha/beta hydrolase